MNYLEGVWGGRERLFIRQQFQFLGIKIKSSCKTIRIIEIQIFMVYVDCCLFLMIDLQLIVYLNDQNYLLRQMQSLRPASLPLTSRSTMKPMMFTRKSLRSGSDSIRNSSHNKKQISNSRNPEQSVQIFFNQHKRKNYLKNVVDNYFTTAPQKIVPLLGNKHNFIDNSSSFSREDTPNLTQSSTLFSRRRPTNRNQSKTNLSVLKLSTFCEKNLLPISEESEFLPRPQSEYRPPSNILRNSDMTSSFVLSNKSVAQNTYPVRDVQFSCQHYKTVITKQAARKTVRMKIYFNQDDQMLKRETITRKLGVVSPWILNDKERVLQCGFYKTLRQLCYNIMQDKKAPEIVYLIYPTQYYFSLFANNNQELIDIVVALAQMISDRKGEVANHQIHLNNIVKQAQKKYYLADWGCASAKQNIDVQGRRITKKHQPYCRDHDKWLLVPQYLSPQLLKSIQLQEYSALWSQKGSVGACDIWSIGCLIFQLITVVPLWMPHPCYVKGKSSFQRGLFSSKLRSPEAIMLKQRNFKTCAFRYLKQELKTRTDISVNAKIINLLPKMLQEQAAKRISAEQILTYLQ